MLSDEFWNSFMKIAVTTACASMLDKAKELAKQLALPLVEDGSYSLLLVVTPERLELREGNVKRSRPISVDFSAPRCGRQLIAKAVGIKGGFRPRVLDTTAGLGVDAFALASLGCQVLMLERSPIVGALLADGLQRSQQTTIQIALCVAEAVTYIKEIMVNKASRPDVIYLDPMYPSRQKSAVGKKTMRILREIVGEDNDVIEVFKLALQYATKRVVVKRLRTAPELGAVPDLKYSARGSCRYDVYFPRTP